MQPAKVNEENTRGGNDAESFKQHYKSELTFYLNGRKILLSDVDPALTLLDYLRSIEVGLTGTKVGCREGGCGACTVLLSHYDWDVDRLVHLSVNACLRPLCSVDGMIVTTVEGIGSTKDKLHPVQYQVAVNNGSQCGYCTPGFVMSMCGLLLNNASITCKQIEDNFDGHICRCTGYRPILYAMKTFACDRDSAEASITPNCSLAPSDYVVVKDNIGDPAWPHLVQNKPYPLYFEGSGYEWFRPLHLQDAQAILAHYNATGQNVRVIVGNTSRGIYKSDIDNPHIVIDISEVQELKEIYRMADGTGIHFGSAVTLGRLIEFVESLIRELDGVGAAGLTTLRAHLQRVANVQVRNVAGVAGNIMMTRNHVKQGVPFPSDLVTILAALDATVTVASRTWGDEPLHFPVLEFCNVEALPADAIVLSFYIPFTHRGEYVQTYKVARRPQNAHALVNAGFKVQLSEQGVVEKAKIIYGGISSLAVRAARTEEWLRGKSWNAGTLKAALQPLREDIGMQIIQLPETGAALDYRLSLTQTLFYKFFLEVALKVCPDNIDPRHISTSERPARPISKGQQRFDAQLGKSPIGEPIIKFSAFLQASGEAKYTADIAAPSNALHSAFVYSRRSHAKFYHRNGGLDELITSLRNKYLGFKDFITVRDLPSRASNLIGIGRDDPIFADEVVTCAGQIIGLIVADTEQSAQMIASFVQDECIEYEELPSVLTIEDAIAQEQIFQNHPTTAPELAHIPCIKRPGSNAKWLEGPHQGQEGWLVLHGGQKTGDQAHFYMETHAALAIPGEDATIAIHSTTQDANQVQAAVAQALNTTANNVTVQVKRLGGAFGGKSLRAPFVCTPVAIAAAKLHKPVRIVLDRITDTIVIGKRHPFLGEYHIAYTEDGLIRGVKIQFWADGGNTYDCSFAVVDLAMLGSDNAYKIDTFQVTGNVCKTNKASNTAFRSFGVVQVTVLLEEAIEQVAYKLGVLPEIVRQKNFYRESTEGAYDHTPYGQRLRYCRLNEVWTKLKASSDFEAREQKVREFNKVNRWRKRGISMIPLKYGVAVPVVFLNQGNAFVNVYASDGSVLVQHGGIEMGQGIHIKMAQIASEALGIPLNKIRIGETNTDTIANATGTLASTGSDLNGGAVFEACRILRERLEQFCTDLEGSPGYEKVQNWRIDWAAVWNDIVALAYMHRVSLSAHALYKTPGLSPVDYNNSYGEPFFYFTYSAAVSEVEIDVLTGEFTILRTDILYDAGRSLNPAVDIGQIEGGFVQGIGCLTTEELYYDQRGMLISNSTWNYKPPCSKSIPLDFRVTLLNMEKEKSHEGSGLDPAAIQSSKAAGEPPLVLASTVFFAIKHAILAARRDLGKNEWFELEAPATAQRIQRACAVEADQFSL